MAFICASHPIEAHQLARALGSALRRVARGPIDGLTWLGLSPPMPYPPKTGEPGLHGSVNWESPSLDEAVELIRTNFERDVEMSARLEWVMRDGRSVLVRVSAIHTTQRHAHSGLGLDVKTSAFSPEGVLSVEGRDDACDLLLTFAGTASDDLDRMDWAALLMASQSRPPREALAVVHSKRDRLAFDVAMQWLAVANPKFHAPSQSNVSKDWVKQLVDWQPDGERVGLTRGDVHRLLDLSADEVVGAFESAVGAPGPLSNARVHRIPSGGIMLAAAPGETLASLYDQAIAILTGRA